MPIPSINFAGIPVQKPDYSGFENFIPNFLESYHAPKKLKEERETAARKKEAEELANRFLKEYGPRQHEAEIALKEAQALNQNRLGAGIGLGTGSQGANQGNPYYGLPALGKLIRQQQEIDAGFVPGSNGTIPLSPEQQAQYKNANELQIQKIGSDVQTRQRALNAYNVEKAFQNTNLDDLTAFSGAKGRAELLKEQALDSVGKSSEKYKKYKEAESASQLEAKEIRQLFGDSITPEVNNQLKILLNPTGFKTSPETAKRQVEKAREIITKQLKTFRQAIAGPQPYREQNILGLDEGTTPISELQQISKEQLARNAVSRFPNNPSENVSQYTTEQLIQMRRNSQ